MAKHEKIRFPEDEESFTVFPASGNEAHRAPETPRHNKRGALVFRTVLVFCLLEALYLLIECHSIRIAGFMGMAILAACVIWGLYRALPIGEEERIHNYWFPIALIICGFGYMFFFTPGSVPDEDYHYLRAYKAANKMAPGYGEYEMRNEDWEFFNNPDLFYRDVTTGNWKVLSVNTSPGASSRGTVIDQELLFRPVSGFGILQGIFPSALGINVGRLFNLSAIWTFYLGRIFNFLYGVLLISLAVRFMPMGKNIIMTISFFPMTLHLLASYSYDVNIIGACFLLTALVLNAAYGEEKISVGTPLGIIVCGMLISSSKIVYILLMGLVLIIPNKRFSNRSSAVAFKAAALILPMVPFFFSSLSRVTSMIGTNYSAIDGSASAANEVSVDVRGEETGHFWDITDVLQHPITVLKVWLRSFFVDGDWYIETLLGRYLGWFQWNLELEWYVLLFLIGAFVVAFLPAKEDQTVLKTSERILSFGLYVLVVLLVFTALFFDHTFMSDPAIRGVQGRYFIPALPLLGLALRSSLVELKENPSFTLFMVMTCFSFANLAQMTFYILMA